MRFNLSRKNLIFLLLTLLGTIPAPVLAQDARGKFTLSRTVRWGDVLLPPGQYSYSVERRTTETVLLRNASGSTGAIVLANSISNRGTPEDSQLVLERQGTEWFVRSLALGAGADEVLNFAPPASEAAQVPRPVRQLQ